MKTFAAILMSMALSGCTALGDLSMWNDAGSTGRLIGSTLRTLDSSCKVISGYSCGQSNINSSTANIRYEQAKQLPFYMKQDDQAKRIAELLNVIR